MVPSALAPAGYSARPLQHSPQHSFRGATSDNAATSFATSTLVIAVHEMVKPDFMVSSQTEQVTAEFPHTVM